MHVPRSPQARCIAALALWLMTPLSATAQDSHAVVHCLDEGTGTVQDTLASDCRGRVITADEATALRNQRRDYIRKVLSKVPDDRLQGKRLTSTGSGFFVTEDGSVLTSGHVVDDCSGVTVIPTFGEQVLAREVARDDQVDLALLRTDIAPPSIAPFADGNGPAVIGSAFVAGYPEQGLVTVAPILTAVEVLLREEQTPRGPAMIVRGDIRKGNSGGPLIDTGGNVIGIVLAKVDTVAMYRATGTTMRNIGFILPGDRVQRFLATQQVTYLQNQQRPQQPATQLLEDVRGFMVQVGCWQ